MSRHSRSGSCSGPRVGLVRGSRRPSGRHASDGSSPPRSSSSRFQSRFASITNAPTSISSTAAIGLSAWQAEIEGVRFRVGGNASTVFMPADADGGHRAAARAANAHETINVSLDLDDRPANVVAVPGDRWTLPASAGATKQQPREISPARLQGLGCRVNDAECAVRRES